MTHDLTLQKRIERVHKIVNVIASQQHDTITEMVMADYVRSELDVIRALKVRTKAAVGGKL